MTYRGSSHSFYVIYVSHEAIVLKMNKKPRPRVSQEIGNQSWQTRNQGIALNNKKVQSSCYSRLGNSHQWDSQWVDMLSIQGWHLTCLPPAISSKLIKVLVAWSSFSLIWLQSPRNVATISCKTSTCRLKKAHNKLPQWPHSMCWTRTLVTWFGQMFPKDSGSTTTTPPKKNGWNYPSHFICLQKPKTSHATTFHSLLFHLHSSTKDQMFNKTYAPHLPFKKKYIPA